MKFIILFILTFTFCVQAQSDELICNKIFNEITEKSPIKNTSPSVIELEIKDNILKSFIWDSQKIEMHFGKIAKGINQLSQKASQTTSLFPNTLSNFSNSKPVVFQLR